MRDVLLKAAVLTFIVFIVGIYVGLNIERGRVTEVSSRITEIENLWNDVRLLQSFIQESSSGSSCDYLLDQNLVIGDRIYQEGLKIETYENANKLDSSILLEKKRYALLDLQFWFNSIDLKKRCDANYSTVIYFYSQYNKTSEQTFQDRTLFDLKQKCGPQIIYITFPADLDISTIEVIKNTYNLRKFPSILINESLQLQSPMSLDELEKYVVCE